MPDKRPVVVYGASGFSGRLVAEFLREYNVPFIAAGRNGQKIKDIMSRVPGIEAADYEVVEVAHTPDDLAKVFSGAKVVCNTVGPALYYGATVVEAALKAGCHYVDIGGEQAWHRNVAENWGRKFAEKGLLVAPATAYMSAPSDAAARICMESTAIDTLEILTMFYGFPTYGSTQTIFAGIPTEGYYLEKNRYQPWPRATGYEVVVPGYIRTQLALSWSGFPHPVWYRDNTQVANVRVLGGLLVRQIMENVLATEKHYEEHIKPLPESEQKKMLSEMANSVQAGTPPRENPRDQRTIDVIVGRGSTEFVQCAIFGTCCYRQTGLLQAFAAHYLIHSAPKQVGYASPAAAFGSREILRTLESYGFSKMKMLS
ncbi:MAG TPA: DUF5938 domain-containing protein [Candidatus Acidoferrales bacterium]|nr:DUF5938 domain-containing protein [Candidatus Acidoferrales bacterium]